MPRKTYLKKIPSSVGNFEIKQGFFFYSLVMPVKWHNVNDCLEQVSPDFESDIVVRKSMFESTLLEEMHAYNVGHLDIARMINDKLNNRSK